MREREVERARNDELRASRARIVEAADAARRRIERDLHDGAQQRLVLVSLTLKRAEARAKGTPAEEVPSRRRSSCARGWPSCATSRTGSTRPCSASTALAPRSTASSPAAVPGGGARRARARRAGGRGRDLLHHRRSADERGQVRAGDPGLGHDRGAGRHARGRGGRRRRRRGEHGRRPGLRGLEDRLDAIGGTLTVHSRAGKGTTIRACAPLHRTSRARRGARKARRGRDRSIRPMWRAAAQAMIATWPPLSLSPTPRPAGASWRGGHDCASAWPRDGGPDRSSAGWLGARHPRPLRRSLCERRRSSVRGRVRRSRAGSWRWSATLAGSPAWAAPGSRPGSVRSRRPRGSSTGSRRAWRHPVP